MRITYGGIITDKRPVVYCDAHYARDVNDMKSRFGFVLFLNGRATVWRSRKQSCTDSSTTSSTTDFKYIVGHLASHKITRIRSLLCDIGAHQLYPTTLHNDNQSTIKLVMNFVHHRRTEHIDLKYHILRKCDHNGVTPITYICIVDQIADILIKPLPRDKFQRMRNMIGLTE